MKSLFATTLLLAAYLFGCQPAPKQQEQPSAYYQEKYRPQFHFSPEANWMNDPNGMVYYQGEYHLFYQYYPDSTVWGPMHWGHAVSKDMVRWEHLPIALYPDSLGYIFSGSAVVDWKNTTGFGTADNPPMVAIYTYHQMEKERAGDADYQYQGIAYSLDKGRSWTKHEGNPVLPNQGVRDFRDPKVSWLAVANKWVMTLAVADHISFYSSPDLKNWTFESDFGKDLGSHGGVWECPDLFPLTVEGTDETKWVLLVSINPGGPKGGSATQYFVGAFDGKVFTSEDNQTRWLDHGTDNYAGVTWSDVPAEDGRRLLLGWMSNWQYAQVVPTSPWRSAMTLPRELKLRKLAGDYVLANPPAKEVESIYGASTSLQVVNNEPISISDSTYRIRLTAIAPDFDGLTVRLSNELEEKVEIIFSDKAIFFDRTQSGLKDFEKGFAARHEAPLLLDTDSLSVDIFVDASSIEVFINDGSIVITELVFPSTPYNRVTASWKEGIVVEALDYTPIMSIWR